MTIQSSNTFLAGDSFAAIRGNSASWKAQAQNALASLQSGSVSSDFIFRILDQLGGAISALTQWKVISGLDAYATGQGYPSTMSVDCAATITAGQSVISWVVTNFPSDAGGFLQAYTLNADGSRTARTFTTIQTQGLQTSLSNFISTIS